MPAKRLARSLGIAWEAAGGIECQERAGRSDVRGILVGLTGTWTKWGSGLTGHPTIVELLTNSLTAVLMCTEH